MALLRAPRDAAGRPIQRVLLIANPASRRASRLQPIAIEALQAAGIQCDARGTTGPGHAGMLARELGPAYDAIFTLGGDGTVMEVVDALAHAGPPVGILPGGTGNILARALGIPMRLRRAVGVLLSGDEASVDLGRLAGVGRFAIGVGVGIDATMIATTPGPWKRRVGVLAYVVSGTAAVLRAERFLARVIVDGLAVERPASAVLVANFGTLLHGLITVGPGIRADDGALDVCIFDPDGLTDSVRLAQRLLTRRFAPDPAMTYLSGREITITTDPLLPAEADGEMVGSTPLAITVDPLAARLLVPHRRGNRQ